MSTIAARAEALLGMSVVSTSPLAGGAVCSATRLRLSDGRSAFVKTRPRPPAGFFDVEAAGLRWLGAAGAPTPDVLAESEDCLILSWIEPGRASAESADGLGRALANMHAAGASGFGADRDGFIAVLPLPNDPADSWAEFWSTRRVVPYLRAARDRGSLSVDGARVIEEVLQKLPELAGPAEPPCRIHGDLWSGNVVWGSDGTARVVDPAAHGGHRETDLAMLSLFGTPQLARIISAYDEVSPLADGWQERVALHQLHPLLVHAVLFGGSYGERAVASARSLLAGTAGSQQR